MMWIFSYNTSSLPVMNSSHDSSHVSCNGKVSDSIGNDTKPSAEEETLQQIIIWVNLYVPPILIILGNVFNILAILVMRHKYFRNLSTSVYMVAGAINDAVSLLISLIAHWVSVNFPHAINRDSHVMGWMCAFFNFYGWGNCDFSIIVTAAMTADRAYAIKYPLQNSSANSIKRAKIALIILTVVVTVKQFHFWFYSIIVPAGRQDRMCDVNLTDEVYCEFYHSVWPWIHISFLSVCFVTIICSNFIIIKSVRNAGGKSFRNSLKGKNKNNNQNSEPQTRRNTRSRSKWRQISAMLLADSFALLLLTFPFSIHLAITLRMKDASIDQQKINGYVFALVLYLLYSNKCVNFCLYCMTGSRFRMALREVITCRRLRCYGASLFTVVSRSGFQGSTFSCNNLSTPNTSTPASSLKKEQQQQQQEEESDKF